MTMLFPVRKKLFLDHFFRKLPLFWKSSGIFANLRIFSTKNGVLLGKSFFFSRKSSFHKNHPEFLSKFSVPKMVFSLKYHLEFLSNHDFLASKMGFSLKKSPFSRKSHRFLGHSQGILVHSKIFSPKNGVFLSKNTFFLY